MDPDMHVERQQAYTTTICPTIKFVMYHCPVDVYVGFEPEKSYRKHIMLRKHLSNLIECKIPKSNMTATEWMDLQRMSSCFVKFVGWIAWIECDAGYRREGLRLILKKLFEFDATLKFYEACYEKRFTPYHAYAGCPWKIEINSQHFHRKAIQVDYLNQWQPQLMPKPIKITLRKTYRKYMENTNRNHNKTPG